MATVVFDFDSTIISCESLEVILDQKLKGSKALQSEVRQITELGIRGKIPFNESLKRRLRVASPTRSEVEAFGRGADSWLTVGIEELIHTLILAKVNVWIASGGIQESLIPLGTRLKIPKDRILGVQLMWGKEGEYLGIDESVAFCRSKVEGCKHFAKKWTAPRIAVGDAVSDFRLFEAGLVDYFIAYTEHFWCEEILKKGTLAASNCLELKKTLERILDV